MTATPVLILNGASSSGKTTLLRAMQQELPGPWLEAGLDKFLFMLPKAYLDRPLWDDVLGRAVRAGAVGRNLVSGMHHAVAALARAGNPVLADHVLVEPEWVRECAGLLADWPAAYLIGVRCPLAVLEERERARRDRTLGQARAQQALVHAHGVYDFEVDTSLASPPDCARQVAEWLAGQPEPRAWRSLRAR